MRKRHVLPFPRTEDSFAMSLPPSPLPCYVRVRLVYPGNPFTVAEDEYHAGTAVDGSEVIVKVLKFDPAADPNVVKMPLGNHNHATGKSRSIVDK